MPARTKQARIAAKLAADTGAASLSVMSSRLLALSDPREFGSARQQREVKRMVNEKMAAGVGGWMAAATEMSLMPYRLMQTGGKTGALGGGLDSWMTLGNLWLGVGNAALRPARKTVVANRSRLRKAR